MPTIINQVHSLCINGIDQDREGQELFVILRNRIPFDFQGENISTIIYRSENPEQDIRFLREERIFQITFDENQADKSIEDRLFGGKMLTIKGNCVCQPYISPSSDLPFQLDSVSLRDNKFYLRTKAQRLPGDDFNNEFRLIILDVPDNKKSQIQT